MKKTTILIICLLVVTGILIYGVFIYNNLKKKYTKYFNSVQNDVSNTSRYLLRTYQGNIEVLNKYCKSDTISEENKNDVYHSLSINSESHHGASRLFYLLTELNYNGKNRTELDKIELEYDIQFFNVWSFYRENDHFSDIKNGEIDLLISYYKKLIACVEQLQKIKIEP